MGKKFEKQEVIQLLRKINEGATSSAMSLGELLRLCMRLGGQLNNKELTDWASQEVAGYKNVSALPDYRIIPTHVMANFFGPYGASLRNVSIPETAIDKPHRKNLFNHLATEPIAELERLASGSNTLQAPWSGTTIAYYQRKRFFENRAVLGEAWRLITPQSFYGLTETVRTRVLEFALKVQDELGVNVASIDPQLEKSPDPQAVQQIVNTVIYGNSGSVAIANGSSVQVTNVQVGDLDSLKSYLKSIGLKQQELKELDNALISDGDTKSSPGPAVQSWLGRAMLKVRAGVASIPGEIVGSLISSAVMKFFGLG